MSAQSRFEKDIFIGFLEWMYEAGYVLQSTPYFEYLDQKQNADIRKKYLSAVEETVDNYVGAIRGHENQPIWCTRHHMQTCHQCFATTCGDNMTFKDHGMEFGDKNLLQMLSSAVIRLCGDPTHSHLSEYAKRLSLMMERRGMEIKSP